MKTPTELQVAKVQACHACIACETSDKKLSADRFMLGVLLALVWVTETEIPDPTLHPLMGHLDDLLSGKVA